MIYDAISGHLAFLFFIVSIIKIIVRLCSWSDCGLRYRWAL